MRLTRPGTWGHERGRQWLRGDWPGEGSRMGLRCGIVVSVEFCSVVAADSGGSKVTVGEAMT